jgi:hypothetical protein
MRQAESQKVAGALEFVTKDKHSQQGAREVQGKETP